MGNSSIPSCKQIFGERLRRLRNEKGLSQEGLAIALGISKGSLGFYETCKNTPDIVTLDRAATFFDVPLDYLLGRTDVKSTDEDLQAISNSLGISEKAAENMRKYASTYQEPLNAVLESEKLGELLKVIETLLCDIT